MCRKAKFCVLLGNDPSVWSKQAPLPPPIWFEEQLLLFRDAVSKAANGEGMEAIRILQTIRSDEMRTWFIEHGQMSGYHRAKRLRILAPKRLLDTLDKVPLAHYERLVFERDSYACRYCGLRLISKPILTAFERVIGVPEFRTSAKLSNEEQHGIVHAFKIVADHVVHHKCNGRTHPDNLVTSCPACNYGKYNYTLEQLGLDDPRERSPVGTSWDGLTSFIAGLSRNQKRPIA
jgi:hypothetical protein